MPPPYSYILRSNSMILQHTLRKILFLAHAVICRTSGVVADLAQRKGEAFSAGCFTIYCVPFRALRKERAVDAFKSG